MWQGGPVIYNAKKFSLISHHAMHSEYMALSECTKNVTWLRQLLYELHVKVPG